jgi:Sulfatase
LVTGWVLIVYLYFRIFLSFFASFELTRFLNSAPYYVALFSVATIFLVRYLRTQQKASLLRHVSFLNVVIICLLSVEVFKYFSNKPPENPVTTTNITFQTKEITVKPDVYLFVLDEYAGFTSLQEYLNFDNNSFKESLKNKKFFVAGHSQSNYNLTWASVLSMLEMNYLKLKDEKTFTQKGIFGYTSEAIKENNVFSFFKQINYHVINNTFFEITGVESHPFHILPAGKDLLLNKTLWNVLKNGPLNHIPSNSIQTLLNTHTAAYNSYNEKKIKKVEFEINHDSTPVFMYTHLLLPHHPYLKTKTGVTRDFAIAYNDFKNKNHPVIYNDYLQYSNELILKFIDQIQSKRKNAVIIITSDHGYRFLNKRVRENDFNNFLAVFKPDQNYTGFSDTTTTVNLFRILLNNTFEQKLPVLENKKFDVAKGHL